MAKTSKNKISLKHASHGSHSTGKLLLALLSLALIIGGLAFFSNSSIGQAIGVNSYSGITTNYVLYKNDSGKLTYVKNAPVYNSNPAVGKYVYQNLEPGNYTLFLSMNNNKMKDYWFAINVDMHSFSNPTLFIISPILKLPEYYFKNSYYGKRGYSGQYSGSIARFGLLPGTNFSFILNIYDLNSYDVNSNGKQNITAFSKAFSDQFTFQVKGKLKKT